MPKRRAAAEWRRSSPAEQRGPQALAQAGQLSRPRLDRPLAGLGVALAQQRGDDLLDQAHLPVDGIAVEAQVAGLDPVAGELGHQLGHRQGLLVVVEDPATVIGSTSPKPSSAATSAAERPRAAAELVRSQAHARDPGGGGGGRGGRGARRHRGPL